MKVTKEKIENCQAHLIIEMEPDEMEHGMQHAYEHLVQNANIPGFRKGKAPRSVVESTLGKGRMLEEAIDHVIPEAYDKACKEQEIEPYAQPQLEITKAEPLTFKAVVPLRPKVELGDYKNIKMQPEAVEIKKENVDAVLEELRHQHATWEPVERELRFNDIATIDINAMSEEKPLLQTVGSQYPVNKESISPAPGFAEQVAGMKKGETKEFDITYPADFPSDQFAGKNAHFKVTLQGVKEEKLPELDDNLATTVSPEIKTLEGLREEAEKSLKLRGEERARMDFEEKVINTAVEQAKVEYPPVLVDLEVNRIITDQARQLQMSGQGIDEYLRSINKTPEQLQEDLRPISIRNINASLVLSKIAEQEKIEVSDEEIKNGINNMIKGISDDKKEEMIKMLDTPQNRQSITQSLKTRKTIERLTDIAKGAKIKVEAEKKEEKIENKEEKK
ncbi:MAG: trigger factor [Dehalococcoidales bacterium]|nr:trigger factor [Dehalococcoidales bacterium]